MKKTVYLFIVLLTLACSHEPEQINYGKDQCTSCKMTIEDPKFGAEIITSKGKTFKFDAIECMASALHEYNDIATILVTPFDRVGTLTSVDSVAFLQSDDIRSPMGAGLAAFLNKENGKDYLGEGHWMTWSEVKNNAMHK